MSINLSHPSQKQTLLAIIGIGVAVVILVILGSVYGRFLKTQVAAPAQGYVASGNLLTTGLEPGSYILKFAGRDAAGGSASATTTFGILAIATPTPTAMPTATCTDSDGGADATRKGIVTFRDGTGSIATLADDCSSSSSVVEYICDPSEEFGQREQYLNCAAGSVCREGACVTSQTAY